MFKKTNTSPFQWPISIPKVCPLLDQEAQTFIPIQLQVATNLRAKIKNQESKYA